MLLLIDAQTAPRQARVSQIPDVGVRSSLEASAIEAMPPSDHDRRSRIRCP